MRSKWLFSILLSIILSFISCQDDKKEVDDKKMASFLDDLMAGMTLEEKIGQLNLLTGGYVVTGEASNSDIGRKIKEGKLGGVFNVRSVEKIHEVQRLAVEESRLGIPLLFGLDVIHGYRTTFPIPLALAASFDTAMVERLSRVAAIEATADGICWNFAPVADISRDPRWGRIAEGPGEDPYLGSCMARAYVQGFQGHDLSDSTTLMACVKHFALYGAPEAGRDYNTVDMSRLRMFNEYLPPYKAGVDAGAGSVMTAFNEVNGLPASANKWLLTDLLRGLWGFDGLVVTDFTAINEMTKHGMGDLQAVSAMALQAGVDMDMVGEGFLSTLQQSLEEGLITEADIDASCRRILEAKYKLGLFEDPYRYCDTLRAEKEVFTQEHNRIARQAAAQTFVLLKNDNQVLPLEKKGKIALVGPLADSRWNMAGTWSVGADHEQSVTVLQGFIAAVGDRAEVLYAKGSNIVDDPVMDLRVATRRRPTLDTLRSPEELREEAVRITRQCDVVVAVMGEAAEMSGESSSRTELGLPGSQQQLLKELLNTGKPVVMVLFTGRPLTLEWEQEHIPAILNVWFGGTQSGHAIADVVFGDANPCGKLPVTFPRNVGQIPIYYSHKPTGRSLPQGEWYREYRSNYLDVPNEPLYPFGYGLSYTQFVYGDFSVSLKLKEDRRQKSEVRRKENRDMNSELIATVTITNTGTYDGTEIVQLYIRDLVGSITRPVKELKGFQKVFLKAGESKEVSFNITTEELKFYNAELEYDWEPGEFVIMVGGNSRDVLADTIYWER